MLILSPYPKGCANGRYRHHFFPVVATLALLGRAGRLDGGIAI